MTASDSTLNSVIKKPGIVIDLTGQRFGRLVAILYAGRVCRGKQRYFYWLCRCDCGELKLIDGHALRRGITNSCGCLQREITSKVNLRHGHTRNGNWSHIYRVWHEMKRRCFDHKNIGYPSYGLRGIVVCARWRICFEDFLADMGEPPTREHQLDRRNNDGNYSCGRCLECLTNDWPANCRWLTPTENMRNKGNNRMITVRDETHCLSEWAEIKGITANALYMRLDRLGWSPEEALGFKDRKLWSRP